MRRCWMAIRVVWMFAGGECKDGAYEPIGEEDMIKI